MALLEVDLAPHLEALLLGLLRSRQLDAGLVDRHLEALLLGLLNGHLVLH